MCAGYIPTVFSASVPEKTVTLKNIQTIARKEFYHLVRDFRSLYLAFAIPLLLILLFGYALSLDVNHIRTVVVDHDRTDLSRDFLRKLGASSYFTIIAHLPSSKAAALRLDDGRATLCIIIPEDWTKNIRSDRDAPMQVILDGSDPNFANISRGYITAFIEQFNGQLLQGFLNRQGMEKIKQPVEGQIRVWFNEDLESRNFIVPGIIALIIIILLENGVSMSSPPPPCIVARRCTMGTRPVVGFGYAEIALRGRYSVTTGLRACSNLTAYSYRCAST